MLTGIDFDSILSHFGANSRSLYFCDFEWYDKFEGLFYDLRNLTYQIIEGKSQIEEHLRNLPLDAILFLKGGDNDVI